MMLSLKNAPRGFPLLLLFMCAPLLVLSNNWTQAAETTNFIEDATGLRGISKKCKGHVHLLYYLNVEDFIDSFIEIPTSNVLIDSTTISSRYLAGRAPVYNRRGEVAGTCSASFLCMQNANGIYTDISNYLSVDNGLVISWFTPTTLINLELDSIVHSMVTECIVLANTKIGFNPLYGKKFNMIVSSEGGRIYFDLTKI